MNSKNEWDVGHDKQHMFGRIAKLTMGWRPGMYGKVSGTGLMYRHFYRVDVRMARLATRAPTGETA